MTCQRCGRTVACDDRREQSELLSGTSLGRTADAIPPLVLLMASGARLVIIRTTSMRMAKTEVVNGAGTKDEPTKRDLNHLFGLDTLHQATTDSAASRPFNHADSDFNDVGDMAKAGEAGFGIARDGARGMMKKMSDMAMPAFIAAGVAQTGDMALASA